MTILYLDILTLMDTLSTHVRVPAQMWREDIIVHVMAKDLTLLQVALISGNVSVSEQLKHEVIMQLRVNERYASGLFS